MRNNKKFCYTDDVEQLTGLAAGRLFFRGRGRVHVRSRRSQKRQGFHRRQVSRVLNNPNYKCSVSGLRDKIWKTAIEMNYVPNEAARNLKKGVSAKSGENLVHQYPDDKNRFFHNGSVFAELLRVIESEIHDKNCILSKVWYRSVFPMTGSAEERI